MRWIRLDVAFDQTWLFPLSPASQLAWVKLLCTCKAQGTRGRMKALSPIVASRMWGVGEEDVQKMLRAAVEDGALVAVEGEWIIANWLKYQPLDDSKERMRRLRERNKGVTVGDGVTSSPIVTDRHVTDVLSTSTSKDVSVDLTTTPSIPLSGVGGSRKANRSLIPTPDERRVISHYTQLHPKAKPGDQEVRKIRQALGRGHTPDDLILAIEGNHADEWAIDRKKHELTFILRDEGSITRYMELGERLSEPVVDEYGVPRADVLRRAGGAA